MLHVLTASGSLYEIDQAGSRIRRLSGQGPGTPRVGPDGEWRAFMEAIPVVGEPMLIAWRQNPETYVLESTVTSPIERVWEGVLS